MVSNLDSSFELGCRMVFNMRITWVSQQMQLGGRSWFQYGLGTCSASLVWVCVVSNLDSMYELGFRMVFNMGAS